MESVYCAVRISLVQVKLNPRLHVNHWEFRNKYILDTLRLLYVHLTDNTMSLGRKLKKKVPKDVLKKDNLKTKGRYKRMGEWYEFARKANLSGGVRNTSIRIK
jgi:hypothetical protein